MKTLKKGLDILDIFTLNDYSQGVTEISRKLGIHKSTTHALLQTFKEYGYINYDPNTKKYQLGYKLLDLAGRITAHMDLREISFPIMKDLCNKCKEDVSLSLLIEGRSVTIEILESQYFVRAVIPLGKPLPLHCRSTGKVILAYLSEQEIDEIIARYGLQKFTPNTITNKKRLLSQLKIIRKQGYAESRQEFGPEGFSLAFPIFTRGKKIIGSLTIHSTVYRFTEKAYKFAIEEGIKAAEKINHILEMTPLKNSG